MTIRPTSLACISNGEMAALYNTFQALPGFVMATDRGIRDGDYTVVAPADRWRPLTASGDLNAAWGAVISAVAEVRLASAPAAASVEFRKWLRICRGWRRRD